MKKRIICLFVLLITGFTALSAAEAFPSKNDISPLFEPGGLLSLDNPSSQGGIQRTTIDLLYGGLVNWNWQWGHVAGLSVVLPSRMGVFAFDGQFVSSTTTGATTGTFGGLSFAFSKDLYPDLYFGARLRSFLGGNGILDYGIMVDLGILHRPANAALSGFYWGLNLSGLGKPFTPSGNLPLSPFLNPVLETGFMLVSKNDLELGFSLALDAPSLQTVRAITGLALRLPGLGSLEWSTRYDFGEFLSSGSSRASLMPAVQLAFEFRTDFQEQDSFLARQGWNKSEVTPRLSHIPLYEGSWANIAGVHISLGVRDTNPPAIRFGELQNEFISPNLDGTQDEFNIPLTMNDERFIVEYHIRFFNERQEVVRTILNKDKRPENDLGGIIERFLAVKKGIDIPTEIRWDGRGDNGAMVPDGRYELEITASDDNGNQSTSPRIAFVVDNTPPAVTLTELSELDSIFSPNGDGQKDTLVIRQTSSEERTWTASILDAAGNRVRDYQWTGKVSERIEWDGTDTAGNLVPDGVYHYQIEATDPSGNSFKATLDNIIKNTTQTPVELAINRSHFSPNKDGVLDSVLLSPTVPVKQGINTWVLIITAEDGSPAKTFSGSGEAPQPFEFDGVGDAGTVLAEGSYRADLTVNYKNGNISKASSARFVLDITPPQAELRSDITVFSPNGDGNRDSIVFSQQASQEELWTGVIKKGSTVFAQFNWRGVPAASHQWSGISLLGTLSEDGVYQYQLESIDLAGNRGASKTVEFEINTAETPVIVSVEGSYFSPNGDREKDSIRIFPILKNKDGVDRYTLVIKSATGEPLRNYSGNGLPPDFFAWDGITNARSRAPEGAYSAELQVFYRNGNTPLAKTQAFNLDVTPPSLTASAEYLVFSPNGDKRRDDLTITLKSPDAADWTLTITDAANALVFQRKWDRLPDLFRWAGTDASGNLLPVGNYRVTISGVDVAGNKTTQSIGPLVLDTRPYAVYVTTSAKGLSPNADGFMDDIALSLLVPDTDGAESWNLDISTEQGKILANYQGSGSRIPPTLTWNGKDKEGAVVEGNLKAVFWVQFRNGSRPESQSQVFVCDITPPRSNVVLSPIPFSPDNDGVEDELGISLSVQDTALIANWELGIFDRQKNLFNRFAGQGRPADSIRWDGRSNTGELVIAAEDYPFSFMVADEYGNRSTYEGIIPIDILVIRDGNRLKIMISSIVFMPNSPLLQIDDSPEGKKNKEIIARLAAVFTKYANYRILIEGHANPVVGTQKEENDELMPLSLQRAAQVRQALISLGLDAGRVQAAGRGGSATIFPYTDAANRWKNRRVEFILIK